jgi:L-threonylcarbamoyladenylate synthase
MARIVPPTDYWLDQAAEIVRAGGLVAFPTETVYGLGANALDSAAVARIFEAKERPASNPIIVHIASSEQLSDVAADVPAQALLLAERFWPGPLTLVLPKSAAIPDIVTASGRTVAVRVPNHPVALALLRAVRLPIAAPSANRSESISPTTAAHVAESLGDRIDLIVDGGACAVGIESTVIDVCQNPPTILRPGGVSPREIAEVIGLVPFIGAAPGGGIAASPGQMRRHYAPSTPIRFSEDAIAEARETPGAAVLTHIAGDAAVACSERARVLPADPAGYARGLYAALRALDRSGATCILIQAIPDTEPWLAVRDRLGRASAPKS